LRRCTNSSNAREGGAFVVVGQAADLRDSLLYGLVNKGLGFNLLSCSLKPLGQEYIDGEDGRERESPNARITHNDKPTTRIAWAPRNEPIDAADVSSAPVRARRSSSSRSCASARTATS